MKAIVAVVSVCLFLAAINAQMPQCPDTLSGVGSRYQKALGDTDQITLQTFPYVYILTDPNAVGATLMADSWVNFPTFEDVVFAQKDSEGQLLVQPMGADNETCVYLTLPPFANIDITVNAGTTAWFVGSAVTFNNVTFNIVSGDVVAANTTQVLATSMNYFARGQGVSVFESSASRVEYLNVNISGNGNLTWNGVVATADVVVSGMGVVGLSVVEGNVDLALVGLGNLNTLGGAGATFTGIANAPNTINYVLGQCQIPAWNEFAQGPCVQVASQDQLDAATVLG